MATAAKVDLPVIAYRFEVINCLSDEGDQGQVCIARDLEAEFGPLVVLKLLRLEGLVEQQVIRFQTELTKVNCLDEHDHVIKYLDANEQALCDYPDRIENAAFLITKCEQKHRDMLDYLSLEG